ncbi:MAG: hypothetical protein RJA05_119 [Planctomycetota bacterium]
MSEPNIDYFAKPKSLEEAVLRRIKGADRRALVAEQIKRSGLDSIPIELTTQALDEIRGAWWKQMGWRACGGEDLPNLANMEVEIARVRYVDTIHGEVTSLRARRKGRKIRLRLCDEYQTDFTLPTDTIDEPFSPTELIRFLADCDPSPFDNECTMQIASPFYENLQPLLDAHLSTRGRSDE